MRLAVLMLVLLGAAAAGIAALGSTFSFTPVAPPPVSSAPPPPLAVGPPVAPARPDSCSAREVWIRKQDVAGGTGVRYGRLLLTNTGPRPCTVQGYPVIEALQAGQVTLRSQVVAVPGGDPGPLIPLRPNQTASAAYSYTVAGPPACAPHDHAQVVLPHTTAPIPFDEIDSGIPPGQRTCGYRVQPFTGGTTATWKPS